MRVVVFGANGRTGSRVVAHAAAAGHDVVAVVRDLTKFPGELLDAGPGKVEAVTADARQHEQVVAAIAGADAIVSAIGNTTMGRSTLITDCVATIVTAAGATRPGVPILTVSTVGAGDSGRQMRQPIRALLTTVLHFAIADHNGAESALAHGTNPSLAVRCVGLTEDPARGQVTASATERVTSSRISREDVADYLVNHLDLSDVAGAALNEHAPGGGPGGGLVVSLW